MAQTSQALHFVCRSCRQSLPKPSSTTTIPQIRTFTSTSARSRQIPAFQPTPSPELDALLLDWRKRVFTPSALLARHRDLIYKKSRHHIIEQDPGITLTMSNDEEVKLEPMDRYDRPKKMKSLHELADLLEKNEDIVSWSNLPPFLEGMAMAGEKIPPFWMEKITRKANQAGREGIVKRCAETVKKTHLGLAGGEGGIARELMLGAHMRAVEAKFVSNQAIKAQRFAESVASMLEEKEHCGGSLKPGMRDMRRDITVIGILLEMAAAKAINIHESKDKDGAVGRYIQKLIAIADEEGKGGILRRDEKRRSERAVEDWIPVAHGIRLALKVSGITPSGKKDADMKLKLGLKEKLEVLDNAIEEEVVKIREAAGDSPRRALIMLDAIKQL